MNMINEILQPTITMACNYFPFRKNQVLTVVNTCYDGYAVRLRGRLFWINQNFILKPGERIVEIEKDEYDEEDELVPRQRRKVSERTARRNRKNETGDG